jgi:outer membrane protein assembly factor BamB
MSISLRRATRPASIAIVLFLSVPASAADWPQRRGPNRDGVVHGVAVPAKWPKTLKEEWKVDVGQCVSSPVVVGRSVYLLTRKMSKGPDPTVGGDFILNGDETVLCLDLASGNEKWHSNYSAPFRLGGPAHGYEGPRSTPAVADGRIFSFGIGGILSCLNAKTGELHWRKDFVKEYSATAPGWGTAASPLVDRGLCIVHVGGPDKGALTAFDAATGDVKWSCDGDGPAYASPILVDLAGERQVVTLTINNFVGVSATTGKLLWKVPCHEIHSEHCLTPVQLPGSDHLRWSR